MSESLARRLLPEGARTQSARQLPRSDKLPLLTLDERATRSERFDTGASVASVSSRFSLPTDFSPRTTASAGPRQPADVVIDIAQLATAAGIREAQATTPQERIAGALRTIEFRTPAGPEREAQQALEGEYIAWAAGVLQARERAFGNAGYSIDRNRSVAVGEAALPAIYDGVRQFLSSISRSPVAGAVATALGPLSSGTDATGRRVNQGELNNNYDPAVTGGAIGGATAYAMDSTLLTAMDRRARLANFPQFAPVDLKALIPDPAPVQMRVVEGRKEYWRPLAGDGDPQAAGDRKTMAALTEAAQQRRQSLGSLQATLQAQQWGLFAQPLVTGAANVLRRVLVPAKSLLQAAPVAGGGMLASGAAGGATKLGLGLAKAAAYADVDNLVGGKQRVNLFSTKLPQPDVRAASWSDIGGLRRYALDSVREAKSLAAHLVAGPWRDGNGPLPSRQAVLSRVADIASKVASNTFANVFATATGPLMAQLLRDGAASARPGESQQSPAYLLQQFAQSATSDFVWQASKDALKGSAFNLAGSLDRWRDSRQAQLLQTARLAQRELPGLAQELQRTLDAQPGGGNSALRETLQELQGLQHNDEVQTATLERAHSVLRRTGGESGVEGALTQRIETALRSSEQREAMVRWRSPAGAEPAADRGR